MSIKTTCSGCNATYQLKDELAWKKRKCTNCWRIINIPNINIEKVDKEEVSVENNDKIDKVKEKWVFSHNLYWIKQKRIAINEKYFIRDKDNNELLFSLRKVYLLRWLLSLFLLLCIGWSFIFLWSIIAEKMGNDIIVFIFGFIWMVIWVFVLLLTTPKKHISFFKSDKDTWWEPEFEIKEDSKLFYILLFGINRFFL